MSHSTDRTQSAHARQRDERERTAVAISTERLPWHPMIQERFGIERSGWRALVESVFPTAKTVEGVLLALSYCKARKLDVFKRPVHVVPIWNSALGKEVETVWPGVGELRTTAMRTGEFAGFDECQFGQDITRSFTGEVGRGNDKRPVTHEVTFPEWARITCYRYMGKNGDRVVIAGPRVYWLETYATIGRTNVPNEMWRKRPRGQLEKCAEAATLRRGFPEECGSDATAEEMGGDSATGVTIDGHAEEHEEASTTGQSPNATDKPEPDSQRQPAPGRSTRGNGADGATQTTTATVTATVNNTTADNTKPDDPDAWRDNPGAEQQRQSTAAQQAPGAPAEARQDAGPTQEEGFEAWLVDHEGVETRAEPYTSEMTFAHALVELCAKFPASKADILDQNAGAIADASEDNKARAIIEAVRKPPAQEDTVVHNETADDSFRATVLEVPQTPKGGPHWPNYIDTAQHAIDACPSVAAMHAWLAANEPTWKGKSVQTETKIKRHFDAALAKMTGQPPPADGDQDANTLNTIRRSTADCKVVDVLMAFWGSAAVKNAAMRFQAEGKGDLRTEIKSIFQKRHHELTGRDGLFVFADELR